MLQVLAVLNLKTMINIDYIKKLIKLSVPIILGSIGIMLISTGDIYVASRYSTQAAASIGVSVGVSNPIFLIGIGLMMGISPILAIERGQGIDKRDRLLSILIFAFVIGIILSIITLVVNEFVPYLKINEKLVKPVMEYNKVVAFSFPFAFMFNAMKEYLQSYEEVMFPNFIAIIAVFVNLGLNFLLVFGGLGFEGMGQIGLAYASFGVRIFMALSLFIYILRKDKLVKYSHEFIMKCLKFSIPIAFMFFMEVTAFCAVSIISGKLDIISSATNNIIMTLASIAFMVPMAISSAVAVKVGNAYGRRDIDEIIHYIKASMAVVISFAIFSASLFYFFPQQMMNLMTRDKAVIALGVNALLIVAIFQIFDSLQVNLNGILRGLKQTKVSSIVVFFGFWIIGIPFGAYLTFYHNYGIQGLWIGLAVSLGIVAILLFSIKMIVIKSLKKEFNNA